MGDTTIAIQTGTHQGCPLGPLGFYLGIHHVLTAIGTPGNLAWSSWYLDDGLLVGTADQLSRALETLQPAFLSLGLEINLTKCEVWGPAVAHTCPQLNVRLDGVGLSS